MNNKIVDPKSVLSEKDRQQLLRYVRKHYGTGYNITVRETKVYPVQENNTLGPGQQCLIIDGTKVGAQMFTLRADQI